jgi:hypothetical protein
MLCFFRWQLTASSATNLATAGNSSNQHMYTPNTYFIFLERALSVMQKRMHRSFQQSQHHHHLGGVLVLMTDKS